MEESEVGGGEVEREGEEIKKKRIRGNEDRRGVRIRRISKEGRKVSEEKRREEKRSEAINREEEEETKRRGGLKKEETEGRNRN